MLVVTTSVRMVNRVHGNTTSTRPVVALGLEFVERATSFQERLVDTATTSNDTNGRARAARDGLLGAGRKTNAGLAIDLRVNIEY